MDTVPETPVPADPPPAGWSPTLYQRGLLLLVAVLACQLAFLGVVGALRREHAEAERWSAHTKEVLA